MSQQHESDMGPPEEQLKWVKEVFSEDFYDAVLNNWNNDKTLSPSQHAMTLKNKMREQRSQSLDQTSLWDVPFHNTLTM